MKRRLSYVKVFVLVATTLAAGKAAAAERRPNILFCIADDMSYRHAGANGDPAVRTPTFDRIAREGARFTRAFCSSPSCTPSRAAILTGRPFCALEESGNLWSTLQKKFSVYPDLLEAAGYAVGFTRKGWGPGDFKPGGRTRNPAGANFKGFAEFRRTVRDDQPWCFWFGSQDPHRPYESGSGAAAGIDLAAVRVPAFLPDVPIVRNDLADYLAEIERFDREAGEIIGQLERAGELDNTLIVMTSDNGMPFPRAKANLYDAGTHMPLAIRWDAHIAAGKVIDAFVSHVDFAPTFLEIANVPRPAEMTGRSLLPLLMSTSPPQREREFDRVFVGRERHANVRAGSVGYPARAVRTADFLYIRNFTPDRWPAGDPESPAESEIERTYGDIDAGPTKTYMMRHRATPEIASLWSLAFERRPAEELYSLKDDPEQMMNLAEDKRWESTLEAMRASLREWMVSVKDPRADDRGALFDGYPYYGGGGRGARKP
jgi:arylsulfatase A-like enzyme